MSPSAGGGGRSYLGFAGGGKGNEAHRVLKGGDLELPLIRQWGIAYLKQYHCFVKYIFISNRLKGAEA